MSLALQISHCAYSIANMVSRIFYCALVFKTALSSHDLSRSFSRTFNPSYKPISVLHATQNIPLRARTRNTRASVPPCLPLFKLFSNPQHLQNAQSTQAEDTDVTLTAIDFEEQTAGYHMHTPSLPRQKSVARILSRM